VNDILADIRRQLLECARDAERLCRRAGAYSMVPDRLRIQVQRLIELERAVEQLTEPPTPRDFPHFRDGETP